MSKTARTVLALALALVAGGVYWIATARPLAHSPLRAARTISGLSIPSSARVSAQEGEWSSFNGNGLFRVELSLHRGDFQRLREEGIREGYQRMPDIRGPDSHLYSHVSPGSRGWYRLKLAPDSLSYDLSVLDESGPSVLVVSLVQ